jgi:hypothetical protein
MAFSRYSFHGFRFNTFKLIATTLLYSSNSVAGFIVTVVLQIDEGFTQ